MRFENNVLLLKSSVTGADDADERTGKTGLHRVPYTCPHIVPAALSRLMAQVFCGFTS